VSAALVGQPIARLDGPAKVTGSARYAAEFNQSGQAYAVVVGSTIGRGRITGIDADTVTGLPGVIAVISHLNAPRLDYGPHKGPIDPAVGERLHVLQDDQVHFYGQPVAVVVAEALDDAERAAAALHVSYSASEPVVDPNDPRARSIIPGSTARPGSRIQADKARGDADGAWASAPVKIDATYSIARENHNPMEPHATVAVWNGGRLTLWSKTQFVVNEQAEIAAIFGISAGTRTGHLPVHRRSLRHESENLAACHAGSHRRANGSTAGQAGAEPPADVPHDRPPAPDRPACGSRRDPGWQAHERDSRGHGRDQPL